MRSPLFLVLLGAACSTAPALADEPTPQPGSTRVDAAPNGAIDYSQGSGCPDAQEFWQLVASHLRNPSASERMQPIRVETAEQETGGLARVTFSAANGLQTLRELSGVNCREAAAAAALVVALAIDASTNEEPEHETAVTAAPIAHPPIMLTQTAPVRDRSQQPRKAPRGLFWQLGVGGLVEQAIAPTPMLGVSAFAAVGEALPSWELSAGFVDSRSGVVERDGLSAEFSLLAGELTGCAFSFLRTERLFLEPCLSIELGSVDSRGINNELYLGSNRSTFWAAGGPLLRARHAFSELWLEAWAGPWVPIAGTRTYVFHRPDGDRDFYDVPIVGFVAGLGLTFRLD